MERKIGLFDGDGVLIKSEDPVVAAINRILIERKINIQFTPGETGTWRHHYDTILERTGNKRLALEAEDYWFHADTICAADEIEGADKLVRRLNEIGVDSYVVTSRDPKKDYTVGEKTKSWFEKRIPLITRDRVAIRNPEDEREGSQFKGETVITLGSLFLLDDDHRTLEHIRKMERFNPQLTLLVLMTRRWNEKEDVNFPRVGSLLEFWDKIIVGELGLTSSTF